MEPSVKPSVKPSVDTGGQRPEPRERNFQSRAFEFGEWYESYVERVSPARDGWPTEVVAQVAERDVERMLQAVLAGDGPTSAEPSWAEALDDSFQGGRGLRPETTEARQTNANFTVLGGEPNKAAVAALEWHGSLRELLEPLLGATESGADVWVTRVLELGGQRFECAMSVRIHGRLGTGSRQLNLEWRSIWRLDPDRKRIVMQHLEPTRFEEVIYARQPFEELTQGVIADRAFFGRDLHRGAVEYDGRYDRGVGNASVYLGMQGIAVGDVDGDGLEDLYVAEQGGVPNRLLMHAADGTVRDRAAAARVDFLDDTSGVLIVDLDGDGHRDLALGVGPTIVLAYNDGSGVFTGRNALRGPGEEQVYSICAADPDGDGDLDIYATRYVAGGVGRGLPTPYHDAQNGATNLYWRNEGDRNYVLATDEVGLGEHNSRFSLSAIWEDIDRDGDLDLYVANDFGRNNLYRNDGGMFTDIADASGAEDMAAGMGVTCADVELDGDIDFYVSNMFTAAGSRVAGHPAFQASGSLDARGGYMHHTQGNSLLLRDNGRYRDSAARSRSGPGGWAWGAMFFDFENDGLPDLVVPNGFLTNRRTEDLESFFWRCVVNASPAVAPATTEYQNAWVTISNLGQFDGYSWNGREPNYAYRNLGGGLFADVSEASGLGYRDDGRVAAVVDWDGDGRLDLWLKNRTAPTLRFLRNVQPRTGHWISLELVGEGANREAAGALVRIDVPEGSEPGDTTDPPREWIQRSYVGHGYLGSSSRRLHFGLGESPGPVRVRIEWPDGMQETITGVAVDRAYAAHQGEGSLRPREATAGALEELPVRRLPERLPEQPERWVDGGPARVSRVPLLDRIPLSKLDLSAFEGPGLRVEAFAGKPVLLCLWGSWHEGSVAILRELSASLAESESDLVLYPLSLDAVRDEAFAQNLLRQTLAQPSGASDGEASDRNLGGRVDARLQLLFEMAVFEVLGPFEDLPLPLGILLDGQGAVSALYLGEIDPAELIQDGARVKAELGTNGSRWPTGLTGGRWATGRGPTRALQNLRKVLRKQGFRAVGAELKREAERRASGR